MLKGFKELLKNRFIVFTIFLITFVIANIVILGSILPDTDSENLWFYSGIFMVLFSMLFIEPYYSSPKNVITNSIPLFLVFLAIKSDFSSEVIWWISISSLLLLVFLSILAITLYDSSYSENELRNKISCKIKKWIVIIGQGKILYSFVFFYFLLTHSKIQTYETLILFVIWSIIILINPKSLRNSLLNKANKQDDSAIGEIIGVQSKKMFLIRLYEDRTKFVKKFDIVKFKYSIQNSDEYFITGIVFDTYLLNQEKWTKVLQLGIKKIDHVNLYKNIAYKVIDKKERDDLTRELKINRFVGVVIKGSKIGKIKFEYSKKINDLQEADLLELLIDGTKIYYQVCGGITNSVRLEHKDESGTIEGEAIQLGTWNNETLSFEKFGWIPQINTAIYISDTSGIQIPTFKYPEFELGKIPNTTLPSIINLNTAVSHHLALLGITGSGKSFLTRILIKELQNDTKIICVDFTGEWKVEFDDSETEEFTTIDEVIATGKISLIQLNSVSNTTESLRETNSKLQEIFLYAKQNKDHKKICLILEEAHTIVPETTFLGDYGDYSANKALVNKMSQIALQGRKYGVGLFVIAQRTANVSKTVLTQCNTIISFQAFDDTSFNFLGNYIGKDLIATLPNLKQYHAIVTGKAVKSNLPMIVDLTRKVVIDE